MNGQQGQPWDNMMQQQGGGNPWETDWGQALQRDMMVAQALKAQHEAEMARYMGLSQGNLARAKGEHDMVLPKAMNTTFGGTGTSRYRGGGLAMYSLLPHLAKSGIG